MNEVDCFGPLKVILFWYTAIESASEWCYRCQFLVDSDYTFIFTILCDQLVGNFRILVRVLPWWANEDVELGGFKILRKISLEM